MMKKYIIYCIIVVVSVFASFLFFDKYYKKSTLWERSAIHMSLAMILL